MCYNLKLVFLPEYDAGFNSNHRLLASTPDVMFALPLDNQGRSTVFKIQGQVIFPIVLSNIEVRYMAELFEVLHILVNRKIVVIGDGASTLNRSMQTGI